MKPLIITLSLILIPALVWAQRDGGSTVQGDILRGEGRFLQGLAWYELNEARAFAINVETARKIDEWNRQVYVAYMREREEHMLRRRNLTKAQAEQAQRDYEAREERLRTRPTTEEIAKGDALNALLVDLSDPSISESSWRLAKVALPPELTIRSLIFRFTPKLGDKNAKALGSGLIALGRLDMDGRWPTFLRDEALAPERKSYESAYAKVRDESVAGKLHIGTVTTLDKSIEALRTKISTTVPTARGYRISAYRFVDDLKKATRMFDADSVDFAQEMLSDTQSHEAHSVGELLAFMRKYRLLFASAESQAAAGELYGRLFALMREQKEKLGLPFGTPTLAAKPATGMPPAARRSAITGNSVTEPILLPPDWQMAGELARIRSQGEMRFQPVPLSDYVVETELTFHNSVKGRLCYILGHEGASVTEMSIGKLWPQDDANPAMPCRLFHGQPFGVNWGGEVQFPVGQRLRLKLVAANTERALFYNGLRVLSGKVFPMDAECKIRAIGLVDCTIHSCALRELGRDDLTELNWPMPQQVLDLKPEATAARIKTQTGDLIAKPEPARPFMIKSIGAAMSWLPPGGFEMGCDAQYEQWGGGPRGASGVHRVQLTRGFWMGRYEVTQEQWLKLSRSNPSRIQGSPYLPVNWISWREAVDFCDKVTEAERKARRLPNGYIYRLPSEAEWEYACRTGIDEAAELDRKQFWCGETSQNRLHEVGEWPANRWGLYDMLGNVEEWSCDAWRPYPGNEVNVVVDPFRMANGNDDRFSLRGGAWWGWEVTVNKNNLKLGTLCTSRNRSPSVAGAYRGFRFVLGPTPVW